MRNEKHETVADIVKEIRERAEAMEIHGRPHGIKVAMKEFANRIEVAYKRERGAIVAEEAALAAQPRNCDIGTAEEQNSRFCKWCLKYSIYGDIEVACARPDMSCSLCALRWAQMPYEEGENVRQIFQCKGCTKSV